MSADVPPRFVPEGYQAGARLGSGQTSVVYLASHPQRGEVALKLPREDLQSRPVLRRMFENEVQITLGLQHPNIVVAFDGFPTGPKAFLALEYCAGGTLDQLLLERGQLPPEQAARLVSDVARGLEHTHGRQVLHRDVKPANVFLTAQGRAKLGDFGTGIYMTEESGDRVGTAFYMAPEIFEGQAATVRSDIYSLGILAYEVLSGTRPFTGSSYEDLMMAHTSGFPKNIRHQRKEIGKELALVVATAMSRDAGRRHPSVRAFRESFMAAAGLREEREMATGRASRVRSTGSAPAKKKDKGKGLFGWFRRRSDD